MPSTTTSLSGVGTTTTTPGRTSVKKFSLDLDDQLWDSGQEWILIFDNLLKHPRGQVRGCKCDMCVDPTTTSPTSLGSSASLHRAARTRSGRSNSSSIVPPVECSNNNQNHHDVWGKISTREFKFEPDLHRVARTRSGRSNSS